jgi:hypothetical protein
MFLKTNDGFIPKKKVTVENTIQRDRYLQKKLLVHFFYR